MIRSGFKQFIAAFLICIFITTGSSWASDSATLSPQLSIVNPEIQAVFQKTPFNGFERILAFNSESYSEFESAKARDLSYLIENPNKVETIWQAAAKGIKVLKEQFFIYWNYSRPLYKQYRSIDIDPQDIKPILKSLSKHANIYIAKRNAEVLFHLAKYLLTEDLGFMRHHVIDILVQLSAKKQVRKLIADYFNTVELLQNENFDSTDIQQIIKNQNSKLGIENYLEQLRYRLVKLRWMQIESWRKKEALINQNYFERLVKDKTDKAQENMLSTFERVKEAIEDPVELTPRVMQINLYMLLTNRIHLAQVYNTTVREIKFIQSLISSRIKATKEQEKIIEQTNSFLRDALNDFGIVFEPRPVYFVPNDIMPDLTDGVFLPYYNIIASCSQITAKALNYELLHEGLHANAHGFIFTRLNEGMTEYWRNKLLMLNAGAKELTYQKIMDHHYNNFTERYIPDLQVILLLVHNFGERALFDAYFYGDNRALISALGARAWEELQDLSFRYEHANELDIKDYPGKVERLLKKYFPDLKTFHTQRDEDSPLNYIKPISKMGFFKQFNGGASAIAARLNASKIYPFDKQAGELDFNSGYTLDAQISEHNPKRVKVFLVNSAGKRSKDAVLLFKVDNNQVKALSIDLEYVCFSEEDTNKINNDMRGKRLGAQLMAYLGSAVSADMTIKGQILNEQTREALAAACYVDVSGHLRLKKVWHELVSVEAKERIFFLLSREYGVKDEINDFFVVDDSLDFMGIDKSKKVHIKDILSKTVVGKLRESGGFFNHSLSKLVVGEHGEIKMRLLGVQALKFMLNNLENNRFMKVAGDMTPSFTLVSEKIGNKNSEGKPLSMDTVGLIQRESCSETQVIEQAI